MRVKLILSLVLIIVLIHFILYFFNIDLFELFEKNKDKNMEIKIDENIEILTKSLEQLKDLND